MSIFRDIWSESLFASQNLINNNFEGERLFLKLLNKYPNDGMIYYERAEAYECIKDYEKSKNDYEYSQKIFPIEHWKNIAGFAIKRVDIKSKGIKYSPEDDAYSIQWHVFHLIHTYVFLSHEIRQQSLSAITRIDSEEESAIGIFRSCIEKTINELSTLYGFLKNDKLELKIDLLRNKRLIDEKAFRSMNNIRNVGNYAIHNDNFYVNSIISILKDFANSMSSLDNLCKEYKKYII